MNAQDEQENLPYVEIALIKISTKFVTVWNTASYGEKNVVEKVELFCKKYL